jgi:hypothetical protein
LFFSPFIDRWPATPCHIDKVSDLR